MASQKGLNRGMGTPHSDPALEEKVARFSSKCSKLPDALHSTIEARLTQAHKSTHGINQLCRIVTNAILEDYLDVFDVRDFR